MSASSDFPDSMCTVNLTGSRRAVAYEDGRVVGSHWSQYRRSFDRSNTISDVIQNLAGAGVDPNGRRVRRTATCWSDF